jgi:sodium/potassium/calcium exchanger 2
LPWFLYACVFMMPVKVSSEGLGCSIVMLFTMLCLVFLCILLSGWKMSKMLGVSMFVLYFLFVAASLAFEYGWVACPL